MSCTPAPTCRSALAEATLHWPGRDKASDGICAGAAHHAANPTSDHETGDAFDVTAVIARGQATPCGDDLVTMLVGRRDPRIKYVIWNRRMWRAYDKPGISAWTPSAYTGSSPHTEHVHVSIWTDSRNAQVRNDTSPWWGTVPAMSGDDMTKEEHDALARIDGDTDALTGLTPRDGDAALGKRLDRIEAAVAHIAADVAAIKAKQ